MDHWRPLIRGSNRARSRDLLKTREGHREMTLPFDFIRWARQAL